LVYISSLSLTAFNLGVYIFTEDGILLLNHVGIMFLLFMFMLCIWLVLIN